MLNRRVLGVATSALSILTGGLYTFRAFGPTEAEVVLWGSCASWAGLWPGWQASRGSPHRNGDDRP